MKRTCNTLSKTLECCTVSLDFQFVILNNLCNFSIHWTQKHLYKGHPSLTVVTNKLDSGLIIFGSLCSFMHHGSMGSVSSMFYSGSQLAFAAQSSIWLYPLTSLVILILEKSLLLKMGGGAYCTGDISPRAWGGQNWILPEIYCSNEEW